MFSCSDSTSDDVKNRDFHKSSSRIHSGILPHKSRASAAASNEEAPARAAYAEAGLGCSKKRVAAAVDVVVDDKPPQAQGPHVGRMRRDGKGIGDVVCLFVCLYCMKECRV